ncbi:MAG: hypothetical protein NWQ92_11025 [Sphingorhabdus sp.]|jgi:hypothetical protein|uniref:hypothetical protein n=1 Tax=Sphingorhabdus sp. TaxID=1902408 RepID=UPI00273EE7BE|nr:hypothetical protein [Sphingorhabdus sp.]MCF8492208.1 hypothetical protein [Sphingomonadaceae bacterium]MDP4873926.1 hypothetical protein [Sphingorhabdus sp.]
MDPHPVEVMGCDLDLCAIMRDDRAGNDRRPPRSKLCDDLVKRTVLTIKRFRIAYLQAMLSEIADRQIDIAYD